MSAEQAHVIDDLETRRTSALRTVRSEILLLEDGLHALRAGCYEVTEEFLERSIAALRKEADNLASVDHLRS